MFDAILRLWRYAVRIGEAYARHFGGLMAAAVSFFALLSIVPLLSVGVAVLGSVVGGSDAALWDLKESIQRYLPFDDNLLITTLKEIKRDKGLLGFLGLIGLLFAGSAIFTNLEIAFNNIWGVTRMRHWLHQRLVAAGTALTVLALLFCSIAVTSVLTYIQNVHIPGSDFRAAEIPFVWRLLGHVVTLSLSLLMFTLLYKIVPNKPIQWREAFIGAAFAGVVWEVAKHLFAVYLAHFSTYNRVYGSLGGLIILMVWTYYSTVILFVGAEIAADHGTKLPPADGPPLHVPPHQEVEEDRV